MSASKTLQSLSDLINQAVGDALSDLLLAEAILTVGQLSFDSWFSAYSDLPNKQEKVKVMSAFFIINLQKKLMFRFASRFRT